MKKIFTFIKRRKYIFIALILVLGAIFAFGKNPNTSETYVVSKANITESILLSGDVRANSKADLGFAASGRIAKIFVGNNQKVSSGTILAQLEAGDLFADLKIKEINSKTSDVDLKNARTELEKVTAQENAKVESAYRALLSDDLELEPSSSDYGLGYPEISGSYDAAVEGQYKIRIVDESVNSNNFVLRTFDLENTEHTINEEGSTPLGTQGLFISFPESLENYEDTIWYLEIPNKAGASYGSNYNAYNEAKKNRDRNIESAKAEYDKLLTQSGEIDSVALAEIDKIKAEIRNHSIYAPFSGIVTNIEKEVGESVSPGDRVITVLGDGTLEVVLQVSELDVPKLLPSGVVEITFDALPGEVFPGVLKSINSRETEVDGVSVYEAFVELPLDLRVKNGMSVRGEIILAEKADVLAIPSYMIIEENGVKFVKILGVDGEVDKVQVTVGITGSDSMVEIISGLAEGDKVIGME